MTTNSYILATSKHWHTAQADKYLSDEHNFFWAHTPDELSGLITKEQSVRYIFFLHWNWLVPQSIWENYECVCFHMTDVPYGRGGSPLQNLIERGHSETKLTALRMTEEMDAGPIYIKLPLSLDGKAENIYLRAGDLSFEIIQWMISNQPTPSPQQGEPVIFKRRRPEQSSLPVTGSITELYNHIRMLDAPTYPLAFIEHGEFVIEFSDAEAMENELTASVRIYKKSNRGDL